MSPLGKWPSSGAGNHNLPSRHFQPALCSFCCQLLALFSLLDSSSTIPWVPIQQWNKIKHCFITTSVKNRNKYPACFPYRGVYHWNTHFQNHRIIEYSGLEGTTLKWMAFIKASIVMKRKDFSFSPGGYTATVWRAVQISTTFLRHRETQREKNIFIFKSVVLCISRLHAIAFSSWRAAK